MGTGSRQEIAVRAEYAIPVGRTLITSWAVSVTVTSAHLRDAAVYGSRGVRRPSCSMSH
jgi:hypothetical protein